MALSVPEKPGTFTGNWEPLMKVHTLNAPAILRRDSVESQSGYPRSTLYQRISQGLWTQPVKLGPRAVGWPADEVSALIAALIAGQPDETIRGLVRQLEAARTARDGGGMVAAPFRRDDTAEPAVGPLVDTQMPRPHPTRPAPAHDAWTDPGGDTPQSAKNVCGCVDRRSGHTGPTRGGS